MATIPAVHPTKLEVPPAPLSWVVSVDFCDERLLDFRVRCATFPDAAALVEGWIKNHCVSRVDYIGSPKVDGTYPLDQQRHQILPITSVKQFLIYYFPDTGAVKVGQATFRLPRQD